jgi:hypothetical protein
MSAYSGKDVTWEEAMSSDLNLQPEKLTFRNLNLSEYTIPIPGAAKTNFVR